MKRVQMALLATLIATVAAGQTTAEWLQQKKTQIRYLVQQISALQAYVTVARKGYLLAQSGLSVIGEVKRGDLTLHAGYFSSLAGVNDKLKGWTEVTAIGHWNDAIVNACRRQKRNLLASETMSAAEIAYINGVFKSLLDGCTDISNELERLVTPGRLQMTDEARIKGIDSLYRQMEERVRFIQEFGDDNGKLALQRLRSTTELKEELRLGE